ncbi:MAG: hypothetical protein MI867_24790 [Pseudomonadales bacterium]|nr:hypothetical protein [Pseudomonadales bacterium]
MKTSNPSHRFSQRVRAKVASVAALCLLTPISLNSVAAEVSENEPPRNTYLADSAWPMTHRTPYVQGSSPLPGPTARETTNAPKYTNTGLVNITLANSAPYEDGTIVIWGSSIDYIYKLEATPEGSNPRIDRIRKPDGISLTNAITGAYTILDRDNRFYVPGRGKLYAYTDSVAGDAFSDIQLAQTFELPADSLRGTENEDPIVGINMTYDGYIAIATKRGTVAVVSRDFSEFRYVWLGESETGEEVSNSIAVDEDGGIYVVTSEKMYRVQWTGSELSLDPATGAWASTYENGADVQVPGRLGAGSGSTPSLMGVGDQDKFVVITDGQAITNLVLFWRDELPEGWQPIAPGKDIRIAAEVPVNYGDPERPYSASEQSVMVRGYGAVVVSNDYGSDIAQSENPLISNLINAWVVFFSNTPKYAPYGVEKFEWDPETRTLATAWVNPDISCPNGIPTMSEASNLFYCIGQRKKVWNLEALDWDTGESVFYRPMSIWPLHNSFYASTQVGPFGGIWTGTVSGAVQLSVDQE